MTASLYDWPKTAAFGRSVPKIKFYEHATPSTKVRERFVAEVKSILWAYKLAEETIHLAGDAVVPEIQVFVVEAKGGDVSNDVLTVIDKAVQTPIIFEVTRTNDDRPQVRMVAAHKQLGSGAPRVSGYFSGNWLPGNAKRAPLPQALDLPTLYYKLLAPLLPLAHNSSESLPHAISRIDQAGKLDREILRLEREIRNERQFNRKVALRHTLQERVAMHDTLLNADETREEDSQWRN